MSKTLHIKNGRILNPAPGREEAGDLYIADGMIVEELPGQAERVIDAEGLLVVPGLTDLHVHLREPGMEAAETIQSGSRAAAAGGFTAIVAMPNTQPPMDTPEQVRLALDRCRQQSLSIGICGCLTQGRNGQVMADLAALAHAGVCAFSDDGSTVCSESVMRQAMQAAADLQLPVMDHAEDPNTQHGGVMHQAAASRRAGLPGIPRDVEIRMVERDVKLAAETGARIHIQHVSTRQACTVIAEARESGLPVSGEATPHHLMFCDEDVEPENTHFKMNPPLRESDDRAALRQAVIDGVITAFATDHAPHTRAAKARGFRNAPFGIIGLETAVAVTYTLMVQQLGMPPAEWLARWTTGPAAILGRPCPGIRVGTPAHLALLDTTTPRTVDAARFFSRSRNTPFDGMTLTGSTVYTIHGGQVIYAYRAQ